MKRVSEEIKKGLQVGSIFYLHPDRETKIHFVPVSYNPYGVKGVKSNGINFGTRSTYFKPWSELMIEGEDRSVCVSDVSDLPFNNHIAVEMPSCLEGTILEDVWLIDKSKDWLSEENQDERMDLFWKWCGSVATIKSGDYYYIPQI